MATKTFKPGEYALHPKWKVSITPDYINVSMFSWEDEITQVKSFEKHDLLNLEMFLMDDATSYYADKVMDWLKSEGIEKRQKMMMW